MGNLPCPTCHGEPVYCCETRFTYGRCSCGEHPEETPACSACWGVGTVPAVVCPTHEVPVEDFGEHIACPECPEDYALSWHDVVMEYADAQKYKGDTASADRMLGELVDEMNSTVTHTCPSGRHTWTDDAGVISQCNECIREQGQRYRGEVTA